MVDRDRQTAVEVSIGSARRHQPAVEDPPITVELTDGGSVWIDAAAAGRYFPGDALVAVPHDDELWLVPLIGPQAGGLLLKQRNRAGDRAALVAEALRACGRPVPAGPCPARWDHQQGALRVSVA